MARQRVLATSLCGTQVNVPTRTVYHVFFYCSDFTCILSHTERVFYKGMGKVMGFVSLLALFFFHSLRVGVFQIECSSMSLTIIGR